MSNPAKQIVLGAALLVGITMVANADPPPRTGVPDVSVAVLNSHPYTSGVGPKAGPNGRLRAEHYQASPDYATNIANHPYASGTGLKVGPNHALRVKHYQVPPDYDADLAMHPYTSGIGPTVDVPRNRAGDLRPVSASHYNR